MRVAVPLCEILGAAFSSSTSVALGKSDIELIEIAVLLEMSPSVVWTRLHPLILHGLCSVRSSSDGRTYIRLCRAANDPNTLPTDPKIPLEERIDSRAPYPTKSLMNRLRRIAFSDEGPHKLKRGRPPIGRSQEFRDNRAVLDFWYDFMRKVEAEFGNDASLAVGPREALICSPYAIAGASYIAFGPDASGRLSGPIDLACAVLNRSRQSLWPSLVDLTTLSATTIRSSGSGDVSLSIAPGWRVRKMERPQPDHTIPSSENAEPHS